ncbi:MAG: hypothetical protein H8E62_06735 [Planctomycetes bacterium]|nr:hypothetical protein [Planctomycetota bacterium]
MKNLFALLCVLAVIGTANAVFLTDNGDFEATSPGEGWGVWAGGGAVATEELSGGNPSQFVSIDCGTLGWAGWFNQDGVGGELNVLGIPAGETVTVACDIKSLSGALNVGGLKAESWLGGVGGSSVHDSGNVFFTITTSWANYSTDYTLTTDATELVVSMMNLASDFGTPADIGFDNITVTVPGKALRPIPSVGFGYAATATSVSWENPAGATSVAAYLLESDVPLNDPNMGPTIFEPGVVTLTVDGGLESATVSLLDDKYYYWAVHVDAGQGYVWDFQTLDSPPTVAAGDDQYLLTTGSPMVLSLDATVTDDGTPTITWTDISNAGDMDPDTVVTINSASTEDTTVTLTNGVSGAVTGWYQFQITVDDGINPAETDTVAIGVYPTCADAAAADPADGWASVGDIDGDCKANLTDFALFAAAWLDCNSNRVTCP